MYLYCNTYLSSQDPPPASMNESSSSDGVVTRQTEAGQAHDPRKAGKLATAKSYEG